MNEKKDTEESLLPQSKAKNHQTDVSLEVVPLRVICPNKDHGEPSTPSDFPFPKITHIVKVTNLNAYTRKDRNEEFDNFNQTIETLNASDNPPNENVTRELLNNETSSSKLLHENPIEDDLKSICENVAHDANKNMPDTTSVDGISSDDDL